MQVKVLEALSRTRSAREPRGGLGPPSADEIAEARHAAQELAGQLARAEAAGAEAARAELAGMQPSWSEPAWAEPAPAWAEPAWAEPAWAEPGAAVRAPLPAAAQAAAAAAPLPPRLYPAPQRLCAWGTSASTVPPRWCSAPATPRRTTAATAAAAAAAAAPLGGDVGLGRSPGAVPLPTPTAAASGGARQPLSARFEAEATTEMLAADAAAAAAATAADRAEAGPLSPEQRLAQGVAALPAAAMAKAPAFAAAAAAFRPPSVSKPPTPSHGGARRLLMRGMSHANVARSFSAGALIKEAQAVLLADGPIRQLRSVQQLVEENVISLSGQTSPERHQ